MGNVREIITMSILAGLGLAVLLNAGNAVNVINSVSSSWFGLIRTVSGTDAAQVK